MRNWYSITPPKAKGEPTEVYIYNEIGMWGITASEILRELKAIKGDILVRINSPGGSVTDGLAIYNALRRRSGRVDTVVDGWACSMAAIILLAGETRSMGEGSSVMVHAPSIYAGGTAEELRKQAELLDKWHAELRAILLDRTGADEATVDQWMSGDTWFFGEEAVDAGLATETFSQAKVAACFDPAACIQKFTTPPAAKALEVFAHEPQTEEIRMKEMLKALGLKEDASEQSAVEAVNALGARAAAAEAAREAAEATANQATAKAEAAEAKATAAETARKEAISALAETAAKALRASGKIEDKDEAEASAKAMIEANPEARKAFDLVPSVSAKPRAAAPLNMSARDDAGKELTGLARVRAAREARRTAEV